MVRSLRVVVVDDDPVSQLVTQHILVNAGHQAHTCDGAASARLAIDTETDVVICDYMMPDESGLDLHASLKQPPPFVLLTGIGDADALEDPRVGRMSGFLTKPVRSGELIGALESIVGLS